MHWGLLLAVYWSILFASAMVALTSELPSGYFVALLIAGVPLYFVTSRAIMSQYAEPVNDDIEMAETAELLLYPVRVADDVPTKVDRVTVDARAPHLRKLG